MSRKPLRALFALFTVALLAFALCSASRAATAIKIGYIPSTDGVALWVAQEQGLFVKHGLDVTLTLMPTSPAATAAVMSGSIDVMLTGFMTVFQAVDADLPFAILAGAQILPTASNLSIVVRNDTNIRAAKDLVGKKLAVPGFGTALDIMVRRWMQAHGVDPSKVQFVEASLVQAPDLLKSGQVDASVMADPFYPRLIREKSAMKLGDLYDTAPAGVIVAGFSSTRKWAQSNPNVVQALRLALAEGAAYAKQNDAQARSAIGKYLKLSPEVVAEVGMPSISTAVTPSNLVWLLEVMNQQNLLQKKPELSTLIEP